VEVQWLEQLVLVPFRDVDRHLVLQDVVNHLLVESFGRHLGALRERQLSLLKGKWVELLRRGNIDVEGNLANVLNL